MKILLVGEYSRLHNSLKEGLQALGHEVFLVSTGDHFKKFPSDILLERKFTKGFMGKVKVGLYKILGIDINSISIKNQFFRHKNSFIGFDVVQLINESPFGLLPKEEKKIVSFLKANNKKLFLLSCGTDYLSVKYAFEKKFRYSILSPYFEEKVSAKEFWPILKYLRSEYRDLHEFIFKNIEGVIASDLDYHIPLMDSPKYLGMVPNPVNIDAIKYTENVVTDKIVIFHGINRQNYYKKGSDFFEAALKIILKKYPEKIEIITVENLPYSEYFQKYDRANIILDQVLGYDQGYNALEAMAKGKVVFTGAETEFLDYYNLKDDEVCINALPDVNSIVAKLKWLIENHEKLKEIGNSAREFVVREHHYLKNSESYLKLWNSTHLPK